MIAEARVAVAGLCQWTERHQEILGDHEGCARSVAKAAGEAGKNRGFSDAIGKLGEEFFALGTSTPDPQAGGRVLEGFINRLFNLSGLGRPGRTARRADALSW